MKHTTRLFTLALLLVLGLSTIASAAPCYGKRRGRGRHGRKHGMMMRLLDNEQVLKEAGISKETAQKIRQIMSDSEKAIVPIMAKIKVARISIREEFDKNTIDKDKILSLASELHQNKARVMDLRIRARVDVMSLLSADQRRKLRDAGRRHFRRFRRRGWRRGGGPGGNR